MAEEFLDWVFGTFEAQLGLEKVPGSRKYKNFLAGCSWEKGNFMSAPSRAQAFHVIKFGYPLHAEGYISGRFSVRLDGGAETTYGYVYWPRTEEGAPEKLVPEYICLSPTYRSRDGEYRHRVAWFKNFEDEYEWGGSLLSSVEEGLLALVGEGRAVLGLEVYPGNAEKVGQLEDFVEGRRLLLRALAYALVLDGGPSAGGVLATHTVASYVEAFKGLQAAGVGEGAALFDDDLFDNVVQCGQKTVPLTLQETLRAGREDPNYAPWREIYIARKATDIVINGQAPGFSIYGNWTIIAGTDASFYENPAMVARHRRSEAAQNVTRSLREAREKEEERDSDYRVEQLDARIYQSLLYAQDFITLSGATLVSFCEHVGPTVGSLAGFIRKSREPPSLQMLRFYSSARMQERYLFDLCYAAHALHTKAGAVHGDLHLNNMTFYDRDGQKRPTGRGEAVAYVVGGEESTYVFPHEGAHACLIDFSRAILGPGGRPGLAAKHGKAFAEKFYRLQISRTMRVLHRHIPGYTEDNQEALKGLLLSRPAEMFGALTALDFYSIGRNLAAHFKAAAEPPRQDGERRIEVAPEGAALAGRLAKNARAVLMRRLSLLVEGGRGERTPDAGPAGPGVLARVFGATSGYPAWAESAEAESAKLVDVYSLAAPSRYTSEDYEGYPPWARFDKLERHLGGLPIAAVTADRGRRPFLRSRDLRGYLAVMEEEARAQAWDPPGAETSSWINN